VRCEAKWNERARNGWILENEKDKMKEKSYDKHTFQFQSIASLRRGSYKRKIERIARRPQT